MIRCKKTQKLKCSFPDACPHTWHSSHPYMACTWHVSSCLAFQPSIHALHLAPILMPGVYLAFTEPGIVIQDMVNNTFYLPVMYMTCMLANCHVPCTCPCMRQTFLLMNARGPSWVRTTLFTYILPNHSIAQSISLSPEPLPIPL